MKQERVKRLRSTYKKIIIVIVHGFQTQNKGSEDRR